MNLRIHAVAVEAIRVIRPLVEKIARHDKRHAQQIKDAAGSVALNLGEGAYSTKGTRRARYENALGSACETMSALQVAEAWGYIAPAELERPAAMYDQIIGTVYKLVHPKR